MPYATAEQIMAGISLALRNKDMHAAAALIRQLAVVDPDSAATITYVVHAMKGIKDALRDS